MDAGKAMQATLPPIALSVSQSAMRGISHEQQAQLSAWVNRAIENLSDSTEKAGQVSSPSD
jgi:hypothetical protein